MYDFGQLNLDTEKDYIRQIVSDRCNDIPRVRRLYSKPLVDSITRVLVWSQKYMRGRMVKRKFLLFTCSLQYFLLFMQDECSFVSLRDVERAMIVFKYFCAKLPSIMNAQTATKVELPVCFCLYLNLINGIIVWVCYRSLPAISVMSLVP